MCGYNFCSFSRRRCWFWKKKRLFVRENSHIKLVRQMVSSNFFLFTELSATIPSLAWCKLQTASMNKRSVTIVENIILSHQLDAGISYHSTGRHTGDEPFILSILNTNSSQHHLIHMFLFRAHGLWPDAFQALMNYLFSHCIVKSIIEGTWGWFSIQYLQLRLWCVGK